MHKPRALTTVRGRVLLIVGLIVAVALLLAMTDAFVLVNRVSKVSIPATTISEGDRGETWVIVGSDNRDFVPGGVAQYGTGQTSGGDHADVILVMHTTSAGTQAVGVPRDLFVPSSSGDLVRLADALNQSPASFVDAMCVGLGIPADHLVIVHMGALIGVVDAVGGIDVTFQYATRDAYSGLDVPAGQAHLDGTSSLAYIRSRHPEQLIDGTWTPYDLEQGSLLRPGAAMDVLRQVLDKLKTTRNPLVWQRFMLAATDGTSLDTGTSLPDLRRVLALADTSIKTLPVSSSMGDEITAFPSGETFMTLMQAGYQPGGCHI